MLENVMRPCKICGTFTNGEICSNCQSKQGKVTQIGIRGKFNPQAGLRADNIGGVTYKSDLSLSERRGSSLQGNAKGRMTLNTSGSRRKQVQPLEQIPEEQVAEEQVPVSE